MSVTWASGLELGSSLPLWMSNSARLCQNLHASNRLRQFSIQHWTRGSFNTSPGDPYRKIFFFLALFITAVYMQHGKTNSLSVLEQIASRSLTLPASSDTHPSGVTSTCLCICIVASCNCCGCTLSYFVQEQVRTVKKNPGKQALNELFYATACQKVTDLFHDQICFSILFIETNAREQTTPMRFASSEVGIRVKNNKSCLLKNEQASFSMCLDLSKGVFRSSFHPFFFPLLEFYD